MHIRHITLMIVALLLVVAPLAAQEATTITWLNCCDWPSEEVIAEFEAENPDIKVEVETLGFNAMFEQIQVRLGGGAADPDVLSVDVPVTAGYGLRGWLLPLDDVFSDEDRADWLPAAVTAGTYNGELISAPVSNSTQLLFINSDLFEAAGIEVPGVDDRLTYEQIADIAVQLTQDTDGDGITDQWGLNWEQTVRIYQLQPLAVGLGGQSIGD
ncbi:MAG: extracellular solute-binding protein, partial [Anaerolineaceae bacterium]|nr:extracellular solute-binding protein [Anaerolineaceae bacterium]